MGNKIGKVTFLGMENSGKRALTSALIGAFRDFERDGWLFRPDSQSAYEFLLRTLSVPGPSVPLAPPPEKMDWSLLYRGEPLLAIQILGISDTLFKSAFLETEGESAPRGNEVNTLLENLKDSDTVFLLFNAEWALDQEKNRAHLQTVWATKTCLDYLHGLASHPTTLFVLTQVDRVGEWDRFDITDFCRTHLFLIRKEFPHLKLIPTSFSKGEPFRGIGKILDALFPPEISERILGGYMEALQNLEHGMESPGSCLNEADSTWLLQAVKLLQSEARNIPRVLTAENALFSYGDDLISDGKIIAGLITKALDTGEEGFHTFLGISEETNLKTDSGRQGIGERRRFAAGELGRRERKRVFREEKIQKRKEQNRRYARIVRGQFILLGAIVLLFFLRILVIWVTL